MSFQDFIEESIKFYNFRNKYIKKNNKDYPLFQLDNVDEAISELRWFYHNTLRDNIHRLYLCPNLKDYYNVSKIPYLLEGGTVISNSLFYDPAHKARFAVRLFLSDHYRSNEFVEKKALSCKNYYVHGFKLEELENRLALLRDKIANLHQKLTVPQRAVQYVWEGLDQLQSSEFSGAWDNNRWLTEHLYIIYGYPKPTIRSSFDYPGRKEILELKRLITSINATLPPIPKKTKNRNLKYWISWEKGLTKLESLYEKKLTEYKVNHFGLHWALYLINVLRWYITTLKIRTLMTSLPINAFYTGKFSREASSYCGLALLEALLKEPMKHPSIPGILDIEMPVDEKYIVSNPNMSEDDRQYGIITNEPSLAGKLSNWPTIANKDEWEKSRTILKDFGEKPIILNSFINKKGKREFKHVTLDEFLFHIGTSDGRFYPGVYNPIIQRVTNRNLPDVKRLNRPDFFSITQMVHNPYVSDLNMGAKFTTQLQLYVACQLLSRASELTGLDVEYLEKLNSKARHDKERELIKKMRTIEKKLRGDRKEKGTLLKEREKLKEKPPNLSSHHDNRIAFIEKRICQSEVEKWEVKQELKQIRSDNQFFLTAGSYMYGGKFPPHKTHRTGRCFDISIGRDLDPWGLSKSTNFVKVAYKALVGAGILPEKRDTLIGAVFNRRGRLRDVYPVLRIHRKYSDKCKQRASIIFRNLIRSIINEAIDEIKEKADAKSFEKAEEKLFGTPHFDTEEEGQLPHVGHLCLMISGASQLIYASPILHLRCIQALHSTMSAFDESMFPDTDLVNENDILYFPLVNQITDRRKGAAFAFLPTDHHHHWHVEYNRPISNSHLAIWLRLGIDLGPFKDYLMRHTEDFLRVHEPDGTPYTQDGVPTMKGELNNLFKLLEDYCKIFKDLYSDPEEESTSDQLIYDLFKKFTVSESDNLLKPVNDKPIKINSEINKMSNKTHNHIFSFLLKQIRQHSEKLKDEDWEKLIQEINDVYTFEEIEEIYGVMDIEDREEAAE
jgi:hypothetical protein